MKYLIQSIIRKLLENAMQLCNVDNYVTVQSERVSHSHFIRQSFGHFEGEPFRLMTNVQKNKHCI